MEKTVEILKEIIDEKGIGYLDKSTYTVYRKLLAKKVAPVDARLVLITLLAGIHRAAFGEADKALTADKIQKECCLQQSKADELASMYIALFSTRNTEEWKEKEGKGFDEFCGKEWAFTWDGDAVWHSNGVHIDCYCTAEVKFKVCDKGRARQEMEKKLKKNPFVAVEKIYQYYEEKMKALLDVDMEEYVMAEDYYPPVMEDYHSNAEYVLKEFCKQQGLELVGIDCDGSMSDFEPDYPRYRW